MYSETAAEEYPPQVVSENVTAYLIFVVTDNTIRTRRITLKANTPIQ
jgi:hypothetical protein